MQILTSNDVKIYNLSAGKTLPEWISEKKRRKLIQRDIDVRRRIELIQDFTMPDNSSCIEVSEDGQYIFASGAYKPRVRCFDVNNLSMKFERCLDSEVIKMILLSRSYEKLAFLEEDRFLEFHIQSGHYYRMRIPKFGRDMIYNSGNSDLYVVGTGPDIYRLNLEVGTFMAPFSSETAESLNVLALNHHYGLLLCGTAEGLIEGWDPRSRKKVSSLDCINSMSQDYLRKRKVPGVTALKFRDPLRIGVGLSTGHILLFDIRSNKSFMSKDHNFGQPIKQLEFPSALCAERNFVPDDDIVLSMDETILKAWRLSDASPLFAIQPPETTLNDLCVVPGSGLMFMANNAPKILSYYVPSLGPAPKWCSFLDSITEELEESHQPEVYDDYKFVTLVELEEMNLGHLIGTSIIKSYLHGYFIDSKLYFEAKRLLEPAVPLENKKKSKIRKQLDKEREKNKSLAKDLQEKPDEGVNKDLAESLLRGKDRSDKKAKNSNILTDSRFKELFENPDFQVDPESEEFRLVNPSVKKIKERRPVEKGKNSESSNDDEAGESSKSDSDPEPTTSSNQNYSFDLIGSDDEEFAQNHSTDDLSAGKGKTLLQQNESQTEDQTVDGPVSSREMSFVPKSSNSKKKPTRSERAIEHVRDRRRLKRSAKNLEKHGKKLQSQKR